MKDAFLQVIDFKIRDRLRYYFFLTIRQVRRNIDVNCNTYINHICIAPECSLLRGIDLCIHQYPVLHGGVMIVALIL